MEVELRAGAKLDLASGAELAAQTAELGDKLDALNGEPLLERVNTGGLTVAAGGTIGGGANGAGVPVFVCPQGMTARIVRMTVNNPAATPSAPIVAGWLQAYVDAASVPANLAFQTPVVGSTTVAPVILTDGSHSAIMLRDQQQLVVVGAGLVAGQVYAVGLQVWLYATPGY